MSEAKGRLPERTEIMASCCPGCDAEDFCRLVEAQVRAGNVGPEDELLVDCENCGESIVKLKVVQD